MTPRGRTRPVETPPGIDRGGEAPPGEEEQSWRLGGGSLQRVPEPVRLADPADGPKIGVFETMRLVDGEAPLLALHRSRLAAACERVGLEMPREDLTGVVREAASRAGLRDGVARLVILPERQVVTVRRLPRGLAAEKIHGVRLVSARIAWDRPTLKHTARGPLERAERDAGSEVVRRGRDSRLLETTRSNLFAVTDSGLCTAPARVVLPGVARRLVIESAAAFGVPVLWGAPRMRDRERWIEMFVTNAVRGVRPVVAIDGRRVPRPRRRGLLRRLQQAVDARMGLVD